MKEMSGSTGEFHIIYNFGRQKEEIKQHRPVNSNRAFSSTSAGNARESPSVKRVTDYYSSTVNDGEDNMIPNNSNLNVDLENDVTLITTSDFRNMKLHLIPLIERWKGPISLAVFALNLVELNRTIQFINYASACHSFIKQYVNFHLVFPTNVTMSSSNVTAAAAAAEQIFVSESNSESETKSTAILCQNFYNDIFLDRSKEEQPADSLSFVNADSERLFTSFTSLKKKTSKHPINLLRNIARSTIGTRFSFVIDINMLPSASLRTQFNRFIKTKFGDGKGNTAAVATESKTVYVVPAFETKHGETPRTKAQLLTLLESYQGRPYQFDLCWKCQVHTDYESWQRESTSSTNELSVLFEVLWKDPWEPFFISNNQQVPFYDERFTSTSETAQESNDDGGSNGGFSRLSQLCELHMNGFKFAILNDAFLIHPFFKNRDSIHFEQRNQNELEENRENFNQFKLDIKNKYPDSGRTCY